MLRHIAIPLFLLAGCLAAVPIGAQEREGWVSPPPRDMSQMDSTSRPGGQGSSAQAPQPGAEGRARRPSADPDRSSGGPSATGSLPGMQRQPGQPSTVGPTPREQELLRRGRQRVRQGICDGC